MVHDINKKKKKNSYKHFKHLDQNDLIVAFNFSPHPRHSVSLAAPRCLLTLKPVTENPRYRLYFLESFYFLEWFIAWIKSQFKVLIRRSLYDPKGLEKWKMRNEVRNWFIGNQPWSKERKDSMQFIINAIWSPRTTV